MYRFHISILNFIVRFLKDGKVPPYKTSALRGGLGQQLLAMYCVGDQEKCQECLCQRRCIVQNIMYAPFQIKPDFVTEGESAGYTISCIDTRTKVKKGDQLEFRLILYGDTIAYFNPIIQAVFALGQTGLGKDLIPFEIVSVKNRRAGNILTEGQVNLSGILTETAAEYIFERQQEIDWTEGLRLRFLTPCAVKTHGKFLKEFQIEEILQAASRRVYMQNMFEGRVVEPLSFFELPEMTARKSVTQKVRRYSARNHEGMELYGITGYLELEGVSEAVVKLLLAGEITQIGKSTRFGFGVYRVEETSK